MFDAKCYLKLFYILHQQSIMCDVQVKGKEKSIMNYSFAKEKNRRPRNKYITDVASYPCLLMSYSKQNNKSDEKASA